MIQQPFYHDELENLKIKVDIGEKPLIVDDAEHTELVSRLADYYISITDAESEGPEVYRARGEWKDYNDEKSFFYSMLLNREIGAADQTFRNFWRNDLGLIVKEYARFSSFVENETDIVDAFVRSIGRNYLIWRELFDLPTSRLRLNRHVGNPWGCTIDGELVSPKATRFHTNAMQIQRLLAGTTDPVVAEIGAGYGGLAHYLSREVEGLTYIDFDLPQTLVLAAYNLTLNYPEKRIGLFGESGVDFGNLTDYDIVLVPSYRIEEFADKSVDVFFNSFSLSEMALDTTTSYLQQIHRITKSYFFHNNMDRAGVMNRGSERIPASNYPIDDAQFMLLAKSFDLFHAHNGDYKEFLYKIL